jgi:CRP-like cAMP-binding protein
LIKPLKARTEKDIYSLLNLLKQIKFFKDRKLNDQTLEKLGSIAGYHHMSKGATVFAQDDKADLFYLILDGEVSVQIRNKHY